MKKQIVLSCLWFFSLSICNAQTPDSSKYSALSFEIGKTGLIYNISFDRKLSGKNFGYRINMGSNFAKYLSVFTTGVGGYYLLGQKKKYFELGIDLSYFVVTEISDDQRGFADIIIYPDYPIKTFYASMNVGYRKYGNRSLFRIGISPGFNKTEFLPGGYISYGFIL